MTGAGAGTGDREGDGGRPVATLHAAPGRRLAATGMLAALGGLMLWVAVSAPAASLGWQAFLLGSGGLALWAAWAQWRATEAGIVLTRAGLFDTAGTVIAPFEEIESVDRGLFAFKPTNGFLVRLKAPRARVWAPGLWWRIGRSVGVGGVTPGGETRAMADLLKVMLADRDKE